MSGSFISSVLPAGDVIYKKSKSEGLFYFNAEKKGTYSFIVSNHRYGEQNRLTRKIDCGVRGKMIFSLFFFGLAVFLSPLGGAAAELLFLSPETPQIVSCMHRHTRTDAERRMKRVYVRRYLYMCMYMCPCIWACMCWCICLPRGVWEVRGERRRFAFSSVFFSDVKRHEELLPSLSLPRSQLAEEAPRVCPPSSPMRGSFSRFFFFFLSSLDLVLLLFSFANTYRRAGTHPQSSLFLLFLLGRMDFCLCVSASRLPLSCMWM